MKEIIGNLFDQKADVLCITTNGTLRGKRGVMGAGCAKEAKDNWPAIDVALGNQLMQRGNVVSILKMLLEYYLVSFPVKNHYSETASLSLIERSCQQVVDMANRMGWRKIVIPQPGCGCGRLNWEQVRPICLKYLDDRFYIITKR